MKVTELQGAALDYFVAKAEGLNPILHKIGKTTNGEVYVEHVTCNGSLLYRPSTDWSQGGPIIDSADITLDTLSAGKDRKAASMSGKFYAGPTCLLAAMRCYVASKYGDEVPDEETKA